MIAMRISANVSMERRQSRAEAASRSNGRRITSARHLVRARYCSLAGDEEATPTSSASSPSPLGTRGQRENHAVRRSADRPARLISIRISSETRARSHRMSVPWRDTISRSVTTVRLSTAACARAARSPGCVRDDFDRRWSRHTCDAVHDSRRDRAVVMTSSAQRAPGVRCADLDLPVRMRYARGTAA